MAFPVDNIRMACALNNTTLAELERALGIGNGVIARWETSKKSPPYDRLSAIADYLGTTVEALSKPDIAAMELTASFLNAQLDEIKKEAAAPEGSGDELRELLSILPDLTPAEVSILAATAKAQVAARRGRGSV